MAWKRSVSNGQAGEIRLGQIREFRRPVPRESGVTCSLRVLLARECDAHSALAYVRAVPTQLLPLLSSRGLLYLHAHRHPQTVLAIAVRSDVSIDKHKWT